jgi:hypothetical protein
MADSKPWLKQSVVLKMLLLGLALLWMGNVVFQGNAGGQTLPAQPGATPALPGATIAPQPIPGGPQTTFLALSAPAPIRFQFTIPADALLKDLLPIPPKERGRIGPAFIEDLAQVPEVAFQEPLAKTPEALKLTAHTMAKINHLNRKQNDGFMKALLGERADLAGLPMAMGDQCRTKGDRTQYFSQALAAIKRAKGQGNTAVNFIRSSVVPVSPPAAGPPVVSPPPPAGQSSVRVPTTGAQPAPVEPVEVKIAQQVQNVDFLTVGNAPAGFAAVANVDPDTFWERFDKICAEEDKSNSKLDPTQLEQVTLARIAALMQVMAPESIAMRKGLVKYLSRTSHPDATRALARLAIFTADDDVRNPALDALKVRREKDYTEVLLRGLRYPLPAVARRATEAMIKLERADMVPELVSFLEEPDPRAPTLKEIGDKKVPVVRELVRINHHRNCMLCHAPAVPNEVPAQVTTAEVPRPDQPLPSQSEGYSNSIPDILVRLDVTYLRQDFSHLQPVADAHPWPEMQRFDFLVRTRVLTQNEADAAPTTKKGVLTPYQRVTLAALRELTGRDAAPNPEAWRQLLELPAREAPEGALE